MADIFILFKPKNIQWGVEGGVEWAKATVFIHPEDSRYNNHLPPKFFTKMKLGYWIMHELPVCVTNSAFSLRKLWANSERDTIVPLSSLMCNSVVDIFKIHIFIIKENKNFFKKAASIPKDMFHFESACHWLISKWQKSNSSLCISFRYIREIWELVDAHRLFAII